MSVDAVTLDGEPAEFRHQNDQILIAVKEALPEGKPFFVTVTYRGTPQGNGFTFTERNGQPAISNYGMPFTARQWWPSKDDPADKADSADIAITVPAPLTAASNGRLVGTESNADGTRTFRWRVGYPIYPDTLSVAIAEYTVFEDRYRAANGQVMPLLFYVFPPDEARARRDFSIIPDMMRNHAQHFGESSSKGRKPSAFGSSARKVGLTELYTGPAGKRTAVSRRARWWTRATPYCCGLFARTLHLRRRPSSCLRQARAVLATACRWRASCTSSAIRRANSAHSSRRN